MANDTVVGWVETSLDRGTIDLLWSCSLTILLCCSVAARPNMLALNDKWYHALIDKSHMTMIGLLGPDFLFGIAFGQLSSARRCVMLFRKDAYLLNGTRWTYQYAFFVDMGGLHLTSPDFPSGFPITGEQLHYLVKHGHVDFPDMKAMEIDERNTADTLSKFITLLQGIFFSLTEVQRIRKGLPFCSLELTAMSFVLVMLGTSFCWYYKPSIARCRTIPTKGNKLVARIRAEAKEQTHTDLDVDVWYRTPVDFIDGHRWGIDANWSYYRRLSQILRVKLFSRPMNNHLWDRFPSDQWLPPDMALVPYGITVPLGFSSFYLLAWDLQFPTQVEGILWKSAALYHLIFILGGGTYYLVEGIRWKKSQDRSKEHRSKATGLDIESGGEQCHASAQLLQGEPSSGTNHDEIATLGYGRTRMSVARWRNNSVDQDPGMAVSLRLIIPVTIASVVYICARLFLYFEDLASLRRQPPGLYLTVNRYLPFLGN